MDLGTLLRLTAERFPDHEAIVDGGLRTTYAAWDARVNALSHALAARGLGRGHRFVLCLKNSHEWLAVYLALQRLGANPNTLGRIRRVAVIWHWDTRNIERRMSNGEGGNLRHS